MERSLLLSLVFSLLILGSLGCTGKPTSTEVAIPPVVKPTNADKASPEDKTTVARDSNQFALDLFGRLEKQGNLFFSPASISTALAMTYAGARGQTAEQMAKVLHFQLDPKRLHPAFAALLWEMQGQGKPSGCRLSIANALWGHKDTHFLPEFLQETNDNYGAALQQVDFAKAEDARRTINGWIAQHTADKIKDLLEPGDVTPATRLVLTNAIYFKGDWLRPFKGEDTHNQPFHVTKTKDESVSMMHQTGQFLHFTDEEKTFQLLEMPYKDSELSMALLLPAQVDGLAQLEKKLDAELLAKWLEKAEPTKVQLTLPKFTMRSRLPLADRLKAMGMTAAFRPEEADLTGMTHDKPPLYLSAVIHEAWVDVNEKGTEAAAATAVIARAASAAVQEKLIVFRADHPFLFLIRDTRSGSILFLGRVSNPKG
jgi:serine protease inhibitor